MNKNTLKSIGAVLAGMLAGIILTIVTDILLHAIGVFAPWGQPNGDGPLLLGTAYRTVYGIAGSYIIAWLAPNQPNAHALAARVLGLSVIILGAPLTRNR